MPGLSQDRREPIWLLDYDVGGHVFRFATQPVDVTDALGRSFRYDSGLVSDFSLGRVRTFGARSTLVEVSNSTDWALLDARGIDLEDRSATLRLHFSGDTLERSDIFARGLTEEVSFREQHEPMTFSIREDSTRDSLSLPQSSAKATTETWPASGRGGFVIDDSQTGIYYPIPIGYPGDHPKAGGTDIAEPAFKVPMVEGSPILGSADYFVVCAGACDALNNNTNVALYNYGEDTWEYLETPVDLLQADKLGQQVSIVSVGNFGEDTTTGATLQVPFYGGFRKASGFGGGVVSPYSGNVLRDGSEVIRFLLDYFAPSVQLDHSRTGLVDAWLARFKIDTVLTNPTDLAQFVEESILPLLPVMGVDGPNGYYFAPTKWDATRTDAVAWLDVDQGHIALDGELRKWTEPIRNSISLEYRINVQKNEPMTFRTLTSVYGNLQDATKLGANIPPNGASLPWVATTEVDTRTAGSGLASWSQAQHDIREHVIRTSVVWDDTTAWLMLYYMMERWAYRKRMGRYIGGVELRSLEPGNIVVLNDDAMHLTDVVAMVMESTISIDEVALDLVLLEHPLRRTRATS